MITRGKKNWFGKIKYLFMQRLEIKSGYAVPSVVNGEVFSFLIGVQLLYNIVLVYTVQQSESAICIHTSPLFWISLSFKSPQSTE